MTEEVAGLPMGRLSQSRQQGELQAGLWHSKTLKGVRIGPPAALTDLQLKMRAVVDADGFACEEKTVVMSLC